MNNDTYQSLPVYSFTKILSIRRKTKKLRIAIFGNFGAKNVGDEAILSGELAILQKNQNVQITIFSRFPKSVRTIHGVHGISLYKLQRVLPELMKADAIIIGGGGLFCKNTTFFIGLLYQLYTTSLFLLTPLLMQKKVFVLGIGFYNNTNFFISRLVTFLLQYANDITVRDHHSYTLLKKRKLSIEIMKDFSFSMNLFPKHEMLSDSFFVSRYKKTKTQIGVALKKPEDDSESKEVAHAILTFMNAQKNAHFWFYTLDASVYEDDASFMKEITQSYIIGGGKAESIHFIPVTWHPSRVFSSFKLMDYVISMRLHGMIFSYRTKTNFAGIAYDKKCESFLASIGKQILYPNATLSHQLIHTFLKGNIYAN